VQIGGVFPISTFSVFVVAVKEPNSSKEISHKGLIAWIFYNSYIYIDLYSESELG
jgi:hypothetical protein